jgi:hypothetical protein
MLASKFKSVMASRGASEAANAAIVKDYGDGWIEVDTLHPAYPRRVAGLGDMVAAGLDAVGVTKDRVQAVASAVGIKDCGCKKRQQAMNDAGAKWLGLPPGKPIDSE